MSGETDLLARQGVEAVRLLLLEELRWYPREPVAPDYGIDLYVEAAVDGVPDGRMLAIQVKAGASYLRERTDDHIVYRGSTRHLRYWLGHSLPVIVVLYDPDARIAYWQAVTDDHVRSTGQGWRLDVPLGNTLDAASASALRALATGDDAYVQALNLLRADRSWMVLLRDGGSVHLEVDEWINKSSGRGEFRLVGEPTEGGKVITRERTGYFGFADYADILPLIVPWADLSIDEYFYEMHDESRWDLECGAYDNETGSYIVHSEPFAEWRDRQHWPALRPYEIGGGGEVARWRLELTLNELGSAFLLVDAFATPDG